jgi:hypothetical protein
MQTTLVRWRVEYWCSRSELDCPRSSVATYTRPGARVGVNHSLMRVDRNYVARTGATQRNYYKTLEHIVEIIGVQYWLLDRRFRPLQGFLPPACHCPVKFQLLLCLGHLLEKGPHVY